MEYTTESIETVDTDEDMVTLVKWFEVCEARLSQANEDLSAAKKALLEGLEERGEKSKTVGKDGLVWKITAVQGTRTVVDELGLVKAIGKRTFNKYTTRKLDIKGLENAVQAGAVDVEVVSPFITIKEIAAFPKVTRGALEVVYT